MLQMGWQAPRGGQRSLGWQGREGKPGGLQERRQQKQPTPTSRSRRKRRQATPHGSGGRCSQWSYRRPRVPNHTDRTKSVPSATDPPAGAQASDDGAKRPRKQRDRLEPSPRPPGWEPVKAAPLEGAAQGVRAQPAQRKTPVLRDVATVLKDIPQLVQRQTMDYNHTKHEGD